MPVNTLLEPNNTIPSWEFGGDERAEVSNTLKELKHQFDLTHIRKQQKEEQLERLKVSYIFQIIQIKLGWARTSNSRWV